MSSTQRETPAVRFGIVGGGWLGIDIGGQVRSHDGATVEAVADVSESALADAGEKLGVPADRRFTDHEDMFAAADLDVAVITTPHAFHFEQLSAALDANLDVLCEKPLCIDTARARELVERIEDSDRQVMLGYQRHLRQSFEIAREHVRAADEITAVDAEITQPYTERFGGTWRTDPDISGGGMTYDTGNHLIDGLLWTVGLTPVAVSAEMEFADENRRVDVGASISVEFENGIVGSIGVSSKTARFSESLRIWTDEGSVRFDEESVEIVDETGERRPRLERREERNKVEAFLAALESGETPPATARDSYRSIALTEAAYEAARTGERVPVDIESVSFGSDTPCSTR